MRWFLFIPSLLLMLTLGVELCSGCGVGLVKDPSCVTWVLDDDDAEGEQEALRDPPFMECDLSGLTGPQVMVWWVEANFSLSLEGAKLLKLPSGIRRHRWLCRECC